MYEANRDLCVWIMLDNTFGDLFTHMGKIDWDDFKQAKALHTGLMMSNDPKQWEMPAC